MLGDTQSAPTDAEKVETLGLRVSEWANQRSAFLDYCSARAWRLVVRLEPLIVALVPLALAHLVLTGAELETWIEAARRGSER